LRFTAKRQAVTSVYPELGRTAWITAQRPARPTLDPSKPHGFFLEQEFSAVGKVVSSAVILLTNKECPWRCLMCDLWKNTLLDTVQAGAIPVQIQFALDRFGSHPPQIKLYNSGSFFDPAAIPVADYKAIAEKVSFANRVVVECHPRLVGEKAVHFRDLLTQARNHGSPQSSNSFRTRNHAEQEFAAPRLEVAMGLETVHPDVLPRLNKKFNLEHFAMAAQFLQEQQIDLRAFVLIKPPFLDEVESIEWAVKSAEYAFACGTCAITLIPTRAGNGAMERLLENNEFAPPNLGTVEKAFDECLARFCTQRARSVAAADTPTRNSPSPQPSPSRRGSARGRLFEDNDCSGSGSADNSFPLPPNARVKGNETCVPRRIFVDTWNIEQFSNCPHCFFERRLRLEQMNLTQRVLPAVSCTFCGGV